MQKQDWRSNFYILFHGCVAFSLCFSPSVSFSCFLPFFPDDSHPSMKSISHLGTGWHWHAACAIWRLMAKLYYTIATIRCQQPIALSVRCVYEPWGVFQHLISFFAEQFLLRQSVCVYPGFIDLDQLCCVCARASVPSFPLQNHDIKSL